MNQNSLKKEKFAISHLRIENFRSIESFDYDLSNIQNIFVGINGAGKSSILAAIEILFSWFTARIRNSKGNGSVLRNEDITNGKSACLLEIELTNGVRWSIFKQRSTSRKRIEGKSQFSEMTNFINSILVANEDHPEQSFIPLFTSYGVNRVVDRTPGQLRKNKAFSSIDVYNRELEKKLNYRAFFRWFNEREAMEDKLFRYNREQFAPDKQLTAVREAISSILPGYTNLHVLPSPHTFVIEKNGEEFLFDQLSDGEKSLISLVGDIARKLAMTHPNSEEPLKEPCVVLIDEIDLHLHPSWQRDVLPRMRDAFENCQFVVSSHSPFVLTNISHRNGDALFLLKNGIIEPIESNIYGKEISKIVSDILEMPSLRNSETQKHLEQIWECLRNGDSTSPTYLENMSWLENHIDESDLLFAEIALQKRINAKNNVR